jgi:hypothetical protein
VAEVDEQAELLAYAKRAVGAEFGLSEAHASRLHGSSLSTLRADAKAMRAELGLEPLDGRERDEQGRFAPDMNVRIRQAAGR